MNVYLSFLNHSFWSEYKDIYSDADDTGYLRMKFCIICLKYVVNETFCKDFYVCVCAFNCNEEWC